MINLINLYVTLHEICCVECVEFFLDYSTKNIFIFVIKYSFVAIAVLAARLD